MNSHKDRLKIMAGKNTSIPRNHYRSSSLHHSRRSNSHLTENEEKIHRSKSDNVYSDDEVSTRSPVYMNVQKLDNQDHSESPEYVDEDKKRKTKSMERVPPTNHSRQFTKNSSKPFLTMNSNTGHPATIYKSQSLKALKAAEPSHVMMKSSIQQEHHDKAVREYFQGVTYGKARKPCQIATAMFVLFGLFFITGLVIIGLTYLYQNIMPTLDFGVGFGPAMVAGSFIFLGVGIKFIYDAHKISRKERRRIAYKGYDRSYVGVKANGHNPNKKNEKLASGTNTQDAVSRKPKNLNPQHFEDQTLTRMSQSKLYSRVDKSSNV